MINKLYLNKMYALEEDTLKQFKDNGGNILKGCV